jgi:hypothetical protein
MEEVISDSLVERKLERTDLGEKWNSLQVEIAEIRKKMMPATKKEQVPLVSESEGQTAFRFEELGQDYFFSKFQPLWDATDSGQGLIPRYVLFNADRFAKEHVQTDSQMAALLNKLGAELQEVRQKEENFASLRPFETFDPRMLTGRIQGVESLRPSPIRCSVFCGRIEDIPVQGTVEYYRESFAEGFRLGIEMAPKIMGQWLCEREIKMTEPERNALERMIDEEIEAGRILAVTKKGLFPPLKQVMESPVFAVSKCELGRPIGGKFRQIMHSSWPNPALGLSMNDLLDPNMRTVVYTAFDKMLSMFGSIGIGGWLYQIDFEKAYRMLPINPIDWPFLGMMAGGRHLVDTRLIFGAGEAPLEFTSFADCLKWDLQQHCFLRWLEHYLDDFIGGEKTRERAEMAMKTALAELRIIGVTINEEKVRLGQELTILGICVNMLNMTVSVPQKKVGYLCERIEQILREGKGIQLSELRSLAGSIATCAMVMRQGRVYTQEIHSTLAEAEKAEKGPKKIPEGMKQELRWWIENLRRGNATQIILDERWKKTVQSPFSDASSEWGMGGAFDGEAWQREWNRAEKELIDRNVSEEARIAIGEMAAVCTSVILFGGRWRGKIVEFRCDNTTVCSAVNSGKCSIRRIQEMVKWLSSFACSGNFHIYLRYIPTECNNQSDALSRGFLSSAQLGKRNLRNIPKNVVDSALAMLPQWPR